MRSPTGIVDKIAIESPYDTWVKIPDPSGDNDGNLSWQDVTWLQLSKAVDAMAHWIDAELGPQPKTTDTDTVQGLVVAYMGVNDIRYPIFMLAALKAGYTPLLTSPRNSQEGHLSLLRTTNCQAFLYTEEFTPKANSLSTNLTNLRIFRVLNLASILNPSTPSTPYPNPRNTPSINPQTTLCIVHSGGTTGLPKPVPVKAGVFDIIDSIMIMPAPPGRRNVHEELYGTRLLLTMLPGFHIMGINIFIARSIYHRGPLVLLPGDKPPTAESMVHAIEKTNPSSMFLAPSVLEDIWRLPGGRGVDVLGRLDSVSYGGAGLNKECGDQIAKVTLLINGIGATETFSLANILPEDRGRDWEYLEWNGEASGIVMERVEGVEDGKVRSGGLYELVIRRMENQRFQFVFQNFPELDEWRMGDLYEKHPSKPGLWKHVGRMDDILVLSNGEKVNPTSFEKTVESHPLVKGALMVGVGKFQTGVIVEPEDGQKTFDTEGFLDQIWPCIEEGNLQLPSHARVWRSMVGFAVPEKPFARSGKGMVVRRATTMLYQREIEHVYGKRERNSDDGTDEDHLDGDKVLAVVRKSISSVFDGPAKDLDHDTNIFKLGLDSLQVLELSRSLSRRFHRLRVSTLQITRLIYEHPTISKLAHAIQVRRSAKVESNSSKSENANSVVSREERMSAMIHKYTQSFSRRKQQLQIAPDSIKSTVDIPFERPGATSGCAVLLTGSTGSLGTYLLHDLVNNPQILHIYCLNRAPDVAEKQRRSLLDRGLTLPQPTSLSPPHSESDSDTNSTNSEITIETHPKVTLLTCPDISQPHFGLDPAAYNDLRDVVDLVIHNAWPVNFNSPLEEFGPSVAGMRAIVDFVSDRADGRLKSHVIFISSIASVLNYPAVRGFTEGLSVEVTISEEFEADNSLPAKQGYGESKHVASCILAKAVERLDIEATIIRAGQLAGPTDGKGVWNMQEWLPSLIATSKTLRKIPQSLGSNETIDWLPINVAAKSIVELALFRVERDTRGDSGIKTLDCFNLVSPHTSKWSEMVTAIQEYYKSKEGIQIIDVEFDEWLDELMNVEIGQDNIPPEISRSYPALNLVNLFQGWKSKMSERKCTISFATHRALGISKTLAKVRPVDADMMGKWLSTWDF